MTRACPECGALLAEIADLRAAFAMFSPVNVDGALAAMRERRAALLTQIARKDPR